MAWRFELIQMMKDQAKTIFSDDQIAVLKDGYNKAEKHFLILPHENISNLTQVKKDDLKLLKYMDSKGHEIAEEYGEGRAFKLGYHAQPSMERLHLHVISDDMNSPALKHKKHWNSFTTPFFLPSYKVIDDLDKFGKVQMPSNAEIETYLQTPLKCHKCDFKPRNMPALKKHILTHLPTLSFL